MTLLEGNFLYTAIFIEMFREIYIAVSSRKKGKGIYLSYTNINTTILDRYNIRRFLMREFINIIKRSI